MINFNFLSFFKILVALATLIFLFPLKSDNFDYISGDIDGVPYGFYYQEVENPFYFEYEDENVQEIFYFFNYKCPTCTYLYPYLMLWDNAFKSDNQKVYEIPVPINVNSFVSKDIFIFTKILGISFNSQLEIYLDENNYLKDYSDSKDVIANLFDVSYEDIISIFNSSDFKGASQSIDEIYSFYEVYQTPFIIVNKKDKTFYIDVTRFSDPYSLIISLNIINNF